MPEFHAEAPQATVSEGLAQGLYVAARAGVEPMTLRTKDVDSTNVPHTSHLILLILVAVKEFKCLFQSWRISPVKAKGDLTRHDERIREKTYKN